MTERETCDACFGTGVAGHSDSDFTCYKCRGTGGVMTEREELRPLDMAEKLERVADNCDRLGTNDVRMTVANTREIAACIRQAWNRRAEG